MSRSIGIFILDRLPVGKAPMLLVVNSSDIEAEDAIVEVVERYSRFYKIKSRNFTAGSLDMVIEVRTKQEQEFISEITALPFTPQPPCWPTTGK
ncbi:MAG: hypothetical protein ACOX7I_03540 [Oscillospiraceae bacterium]|jgi:hypothetical protein